MVFLFVTLGYSLCANVFGAFLQLIIWHGCNRNAFCVQHLFICSFHWLKTADFKLLFSFVENYFSTSVGCKLISEPLSCGKTFVASHPQWKFCLHLSFDHLFNLFTFLVMCINKILQLFQFRFKCYQLLWAIIKKAAENEIIKIWFWKRGVVDNRISGFKYFEGTFKVKCLSLWSMDIFLLKNLS